ncbi:flagellar export chaperone FlgN [Massilia scottii]|uniref:flagellar export chaperone FlgN n=1 Tax=Massilia scottii TaxID=3057166 RepID=UPI00279661C3|nr:flagellar export chaperone FlgN [Massilia sp. CCM 9029]MDQ1832910.1 flagellar export chaperone FlgN [Massilia sp. CCM 9029]
MSRMTREQALAKLSAGVSADIDACQAILALLARQFDAALRHRSAELAGLAEELAPQLDAMEQRRVQRVSLVRALCGASADMAALIASLGAPQRDALSAAWQSLEQLVLECKRLNVRNSALLTEQFSIMQRVLHGEETLYEAR